METYVHMREPYYAFSCLVVDAVATIAQGFLGQ